MEKQQRILVRERTNERVGTLSLSILDKYFMTTDPFPFNHVTFLPFEKSLIFIKIGFNMIMK